MTFRDILSVLSSSFFVNCPKTSITNYESKLCNIPEERQFHVNRGASLKSHINIFVLINLVVFLNCLKLPIITQNLNASSPVVRPSIGLQSNRWTSSLALKTYRTKTSRSAGLATSFLSSSWNAKDSLNLRLRNHSSSIFVAQSRILLRIVLSDNGTDWTFFLQLPRLSTCSQINCTVLSKFLPTCLNFAFT
jgi:hypothetical protein